MSPSIALLLEDDREFACAVGDVLDEAGFAVTWATSVDEARRLLEQHPVAIVLVDLNLGDVRGRHLLDDLAELERVPPMLILSGASDAMEIAAEFGVPCVRKPFSFDELLAAIELTRGFGSRLRKRSASGRRPALARDRHEPEVDR